MCVAIAGAMHDHVQQHGVGHLELAGQFFRLGGGQAQEGVLGPGDLPIAWRFLTQFLLLGGVVASLAAQLDVLNLVLGGFDDDGALGVITSATSRDRRSGGTRAISQCVDVCHRTWLTRS